MFDKLKSITAVAKAKSYIIVTDKESIMGADFRGKDRFTIVLALSHMASQLADMIQHVSDDITKEDK